VIIGAGLAGLTAACVLAKEGRSVLVIERGTYPGSKSMTGGRLYLNQVRALMPELWNAPDAPFERYVGKERITLMKEDAAVSFELSSENFKRKPEHSCTVLRAKLDQWLAAKAEERGALIVTKTKADEITRKQGGLAVKAGDDEVFANIAVLAEGSNNLITKKLGLCEKPEPRNYATGVKEVIELPEHTINERFNLEEGEGTAQLFIGASTKGMKGGGFLYTNKESLSLGIVVGVDAAMAGNIETHKMFEDFKAHTSVNPLIRGGKSVEYSAHSIPEGGYHNISKLCADNILVAGDAAGFALNMGFTVRGMDLAVASGYYAALVANRAIQKGDFSRSALAQYEITLRESFVLKDMYNYRKMNKFLDNPRLYNEYPYRICSAFENLMKFGKEPKKGVRDILCDEMKDIGLMKILKDMWGAFKWL